ncbi:nucleotide-diphospho-sugar transferase-domain-containing protein [Hyaloraphidium curvatum]|nr:nucleotide-diphospho-sugar transferase-domain-containing protein [Hyaloraphidium curvatum]
MPLPVYAGHRPPGSPKTRRPQYAHHPRNRRRTYALLALAVAAALLYYHWGRPAKPKHVETPPDFAPKGDLKDGAGGVGEGPLQPGGSLPEDPGPAAPPPSAHDPGGWLPAGDVSKLPNPLAGFTSAYPPFLHSLLSHRTSRAYPKFITVVYVDDGDRDVLLNWLCHVRATGFKNYVVVTRDEKLFWWLRYRASEPAAYLELPEGEEQSTEQLLAPPAASRSAYNSRSFKLHMLHRTRFVLTLLERGWNVLIADADAAWFEDPRPQLWRAVKQGNDIVAQDDVTMLCGGFMLLMSNEKVLKLWREVHRQFQEDHVRTNEQLILKRLLQAGTYDVRVQKLPKHLFPSGKLFFDEGAWKNVGQKGWPIVVHNNFVVTKADKLSRFKALHMWRALSVDDGTCEEHPLPSHADTVAANAGKWELAVKLVAGSVADAENTAADFERAPFAGGRLDLDALVPDAAERDVGELARTPYSRGQLRVRVGTPHRATDIWVPPSEIGPQMVVLVSDRIALPESWHATLSALLSRYAGTDPRDWDPRVFGIAVGRHPGAEPPTPDQVFRHQTLPPLCAVFPWHWSRFARENARFDPDLFETFTRWASRMGFYAIHAPGDVVEAAKLPALAKLRTFDGQGGEVKLPEALAGRAWHYETNPEEAEEVVKRTAAPEKKKGAKGGKEG